MKRKLIIFIVLFIIVTVLTIVIMNSMPDTSIKACIVPSCDFV